MYLFFYFFCFKAKFLFTLTFFFPGALPDGFKKKSDELRELLVVTLKNHQVDCFEILLQSGAPQRAPQTIFISDQVPTLLHLASRKNKFLPFVKLLTSHGALLEERNGRFETPLHVSAFHGKFLTAKHLVESGSNVHSRNFEQETPLHLACFEGSVDTVGVCILFFFLHVIQLTKRTW